MLKSGLKQRTWMVLFFIAVAVVIFGFVIYFCIQAVTSKHASPPQLLFSNKIKTARNRVQNTNEVAETATLDFSNQTLFPLTSNFVYDIHELQNWFVVSTATDRSTTLIAYNASSDTSQSIPALRDSGLGSGISILDAKFMPVLSLSPDVTVLCVSVGVLSSVYQYGRMVLVYAFDVQHNIWNLIFQLTHPYYTHTDTNPLYVGCFGNRMQCTLHTYDNSAPKLALYVSTTSTSVFSTLQDVLYTKNVLNTSGSVMCFVFTVDAQQKLERFELDNVISHAGIQGALASPSIHVVPNLLENNDNFEYLYMKGFGSFFAVDTLAASSYQMIVADETGLFQIENRECGHVTKAPWGFVQLYQYNLDNLYWDPYLSPCAINSKYVNHVGNLQILTPSQRVAQVFFVSHVPYVCLFDPHTVADAADLVNIHQLGSAWTEEPVAVLPFAKSSNDKFDRGVTGGSDTTAASYLWAWLTYLQTMQAVVPPVRTCQVDVVLSTDGGVFARVRSASVTNTTSDGWSLFSMSLFGGGDNTSVTNMYSGTVDTGASSNPTMVSLSQACQRSFCVWTQNQNQEANPTSSPTLPRMILHADERAVADVEASSNNPEAVAAVAVVLVSNS